MVSFEPGAIPHVGSWTRTEIDAEQCQEIPFQPGFPAPAGSCPGVTREEQHRLGQTCRGDTNEPRPCCFAFSHQICTGKNISYNLVGVFFWLFEEASGQIK